MSEAWDRILEGVLRPSRPELERCLRAHAHYVSALEDRARGHARTLADIENRLTAARGRVFASGSGIVPSEVTALEREWLAAERNRGPSQLDVLWKQVAPERWLASRRAVPERGEAVVTLASDPEGIEAAERAAESLRAALAAYGVAVGPRVDWMVSRDLAYAVRAEELFAGALASIADAPHETMQRAHRLRREVRERLAAHVVTTRNSSLVRELGWLAFASALWDDVKGTEPAPFAPLLEIYRLGYVPTAVDSSGITLTAVR